MKRLIVTLLVIFVLLLVAVYVFIPNKISFTENLAVDANGNGISRKLQNEKTWQMLFPGKAAQQNSSSNFTFDHSVYSINTETSNPSFITISRKNVQAATSLYVISKNADTAQLIWTVNLPTSYNPIKRTQSYFASRKIRNDIGSILGQMQSFFSKQENVYGYSIKHTIVTDSLLVSTYSTVKGYPSVEFVYTLIDQLKKYIADKGAEETGFPMLNVSTNDSIEFLTRVAIPINKRLPSSGNISFKEMLGQGNILVTEVKGGPTTVEEAYQQMGNYISDYHQSSPAIPFQSLITDRRKEPDTAKWLTKIYYPVM